MRKTVALLPLLLCACGTQDSLGNNGAGSTPTATGNSAAPAETAVPAQAVQTVSLTGVYESGAAGRRSQMCVIDRGTGDSRFGLVVRGAGAEGCSGAGSAVRQGNVLRLTMSGDERCAIDARIDGTRVTFPASLPAVCAYYFGRGASFAVGALDKTGGTAEEAMRAEDLAGDRLCAGAR